MPITNDTTPPLPTARARRRQPPSGQRIAYREPRSVPPPRMAGRAGAIRARLQPMPFDAEGRPPSPPESRQPGHDIFRHSQAFVSRDRVGATLRSPDPARLRGGRRSLPADPRAASARRRAPVLRPDCDRAVSGLLWGSTTSSGPGDRQSPNVRHLGSRRRCPSATASAGRPTRRSSHHELRDHHDAVLIPSISSSVPHRPRPHPCAHRHAIRKCTDGHARPR